MNKAYFSPPDIKREPAPVLHGPTYLNVLDLPTITKKERRRQLDTSMMAVRCEDGRVWTSQVAAGLEMGCGVPAILRAISNGTRVQCKLFYFVGKATTGDVK